MVNSIDSAFCASDILYDADGAPADYRFVEVNSAFSAHTGLENVIGKTIRELAPAIDRSWIELYGEVASTQRSARFDKHMRVVAEGETREQLTFLAQNACPEAQGFLFSRPVDAPTFEVGIREGFLRPSGKPGGGMGFA